LELVQDKQSKAHAGKLRDRITDKLAFERGLLLLGCGETTIRLCPALIVTQEEADTALDILEECIALAQQ
ncbi:MAG TPA: aminotransferase class III-fold pyridoxal phosphate-dependent enzyme, partial [Acidobacteriaceae bacterium]